MRVRRLALLIEEHRYRGTQWLVFEPNSELLWAAIRLNVRPFNTFGPSVEITGSTLERAQTRRHQDESQRTRLVRFIVSIAASGNIPGGKCAVARGARLPISWKRRRSSADDR